MGPAVSGSGDEELRTRRNATRARLEGEEQEPTPTRAGGACGARGRQTRQARPSAGRPTRCTRRRSDNATQRTSAHAAVLTPFPFSVYCIFIDLKEKRIFVELVEGRRRLDGSLTRRA